MKFPGLDYKWIWQTLATVHLLSNELADRKNQLETTFLPVYWNVKKKHGMSQQTIVSSALCL